MKISLDLWNTVIKGNSEFVEKKYELIGNFFEKELPIDFSKKLFKESWSKIKKDTDTIVELYGVQPNNSRLWVNLFYEIGVRLKDLNKIQEFNLLYQSLFLKYPPLFIDEPTYLDIIYLGVDLYISSNTLFTQGKTLNKFLNNNGIYLPSKYSDEIGFSKPHKNMFWDVDYHIGDNIYTDGACENFGIKFGNINLKSAKQWVEELRN